MRGKNWVKFFAVVLVIGVLTYLSVNGIRIPKTNYVVPSAKIPTSNRVIPSVKDTRTGIDIRGGVRATLSAPSGTIVTEKDMTTVQTIIEKRLDSKSIFDRNVTLEKTGGKANGRIIIEIPWKPGETDFNPQKAVDELGQTAMLTFQEVDENLRDKNTGEYLPTGRIVIQGMDVKDATPELDTKTGSMHVKLDLSPEAGKKFEEATGRLIGKPIAIFMDRQFISSPVVNTKIPAGSGAVITMGASNNKQATAEAKELASTIRAGTLPFKLEAVELESISPSLGENALNVSLLAGGFSLLLVWLFMLLYYRLPGIIANVALLGHTVAQLLFITWIGITLTLPGIAGVILTIGMGVDANVIIFERIKEELKNGKTLKASIDIGFKKAFAAIFDANMTTLISGLVLWYFGSGPIQSFAITLMLGVALSFLTAVTASRIMIKSVAGVDIAKHHWLYGA